MTKKQAQAQEIKESKISLTHEEMSNIMNIDVDRVKLLCYEAALTLNEDHSDIPWTRLKY
jgi:hypothetical protein